MLLDHRFDRHCVDECMLVSLTGVLLVVMVDMVGLIISVVEFPRVPPLLLLAGWAALSASHSLKQEIYFWTSRFIGLCPTSESVLH